MRPKTHLFVDCDLGTAVLLDLPPGRAAAFTAPAPGKDGPNEDAALALALEGERAVLAVADGMGGQNAGERASAAAIGALGQAVEEGLRAGRALREAILTGFEAANSAVRDLRMGAGTTLAVVQIEDRSVRAYHVGDSEVLVVGQRGRRKLQTVSHSPVGYALEAGLIGEKEALVHEDRHLVSNALGGADMRVEMSPEVRLAPRDTLLIASDGLLDNLHTEELVEAIRTGRLPAVAARLVRTARDRMATPGSVRPSHPDDLTFFLYRG